MPLPTDQGRDRVAVPFTQWFGQQQEAPIRWYRSVGTNTATAFVEAGRLEADHPGIALLAALTQNRVAAYDIDGKVTVRDLGGSTAPVVIHEGFGVRGMRRCDAATVRHERIRVGSIPPVQAACHQACLILLTSS
jgi:hypothetical protein